MEQKYRHKHTSVSLVNYYFVWCARYRRKVLVGKVEARLRELIQNVGRKRISGKCRVGAGQRLRRRSRAN